jgi:hypothetical protein
MDTESGLFRGLFWVVVGWLVVLLVTAAMGHFIVNRI